MADLVRLIMKEKRRIDKLFETLQPMDRMVYIMAYKDCMAYNQRLADYQKNEDKGRRE